MNENNWVVTPSGNDFYVVRVHFSKTGTARFISHLDLNRTMTRALRRAGLPIWYTEGFNKHPYVTFASPLSLGFEGLSECMDFRMVDPFPLSEIPDRLNAVLPMGLHVSDAAPAEKKPGDLAAARYRVTLHCPVDTVKQFLSQPTVLAEKCTKKKEIKTVELQGYLQNCDVQTQNGLTLITLTLPCSGQETVNPALIVQALETFVANPVRHTVCRLCLLDRDDTEFR